MKKNLIKKVFAVSLSIAMACSFLPAANPVTASAAAPYVSLKTTFKTLKVGQKYKMTLKNNTVSWKIKKVETTDKPIATVYGKTTSSVMIKGKSEGRATIRVHLKTSKRKQHNTKTLRCRVKVVTSTPTVDPTPTVTDATVTTQAELDEALKTSTITKITIKPTTAVNFVIPANTYNNVDLIVDAPLSDIENSASFKSITVENIKAETWTEKGSNNAFTWKAAKGRLAIAKGAVVKSVSIPTTKAKVDIDVQEGTLNVVNVSSDAEVSITGKLAEGAAAVAISFSATATNAKLTTAIKAAVTTFAKIAAVFQKGAEDSTIKLEAVNISVLVTNNTVKAIVVTKNNNTLQSVSAGATGTVESVSTSGGNNGNSGSNNPGSSNPKPTTSARILTGSAVKVTVGGTTTSAAISGAGVKVSDSKINLDISGVRLVTPSSLTVQYTVTASTDSWTKTVTTGNMKGVNADKDGKFESYEVSAKELSINGAPSGKVKLTITFRVKETDTTAASPSAKVEYVITVAEGENVAVVPGEGSDLVLK